MAGGVSDSIQSGLLAWPLQALGLDYLLVQVVGDEQMLHVIFNSFSPGSVHGRSR